MNVRLTSGEGNDPNELRLRSAPWAAAPIVIVAHRSEEPFEYLGEHAGWTRIRTRAGLEGWVLAALRTVHDGPAPPAVTLLVERPAARHRPDPGPVVDLFAPFRRLAWPNRIGVEVDPFAMFAPRTPRVGEAVAAAPSGSLGRTLLKAAAIGAALGLVVAPLVKRTP